MSDSTPRPDTINLQSLTLVAEKLRDQETPYREIGDPRGLGIGAAALLVEMAGAEIARLRSALSAHKACVEQMQRLVDHYDLRSEQYTNYADLAASMAAIGRAAIKALENKTGE